MLLVNVDSFLTLFSFPVCFRRDFPQYGGTVEVQTFTGGVVSAHTGEGSYTIFCVDANRRDT